MALRDGTIHVIALFGTILLTGGLGVPTIWFGSDAEADTGPAPDKMIAIEASLATKSTNKSKQPQKQFKAPDPVVPVPQQGVAEDPDKVPTKKPPEEPKKKPDQTLDQKLAALPSRPDDSAPVGKVTDTTPFNPNATGHGPANVGDPFFARLKDDLLGDFAGHNVSDNPPEACIHMTPEGKIVDTKFQTRSDDDMQAFATEQLKKLVKSRGEKPEPVPIQLIDITKQWLCFKFTVNK